MSALKSSTARLRSLLRYRVVKALPLLLLLFGDVRQWVVGEILGGSTRWISHHYRFLAYAELVLLVIALILLFAVVTVNFEPSDEQRERIAEPFRTEIDRMIAIINTSSTLNELYFPIIGRSREDIPLEDALDRAGTATLRDLAKIIDPVRTINFRASIWIADDDDEFLVPLASVDMPERSLTSNRFFIGKGNAHPTGTAGAVFRSGLLRVVHLMPGTDGTLIPDDPDFSSTKSDIASHQYRSFIALPMKPGAEVLPIGVICIDSGNVRTFDDASIQTALARYATLVAQLIYSANYFEQVE
jgi:hypothetical protein